ncbi:MAG: hypothetical protein GQ546_12610, partial [Gammaproteobacteria bacterium]|nr:hypothetical protein [Gammaproteobacteria bacterium]
MNNTMPGVLPLSLKEQQNSAYENFLKLICDTPMAPLAAPVTDNDKCSLQR